MSKKKPCRTNKEALRWCKVRRAKISFEDYDYVTVCAVYLGKRKKHSMSLITAVNQWIKYFNNDNERKNGNE